MPSENHHSSGLCRCRGCAIGTCTSSASAGPSTLKTDASPFTINVTRANGRCNCDRSNSRTRDSTSVRSELNRLEATSSTCKLSVSFKSIEMFDCFYRLFIDDSDFYIRRGIKREIDAILTLFSLNTILTFPRKKGSRKKFYQGNGENGTFIQQTQ